MPSISERARNVRPCSKSSRSVSKWSTLFLKAKDHDRWEKELMAISSYEKLYKDLKNFAQTGKSELNDVAMDITIEQKYMVEKASYCILCRINKIKQNNSTNWMTLNDMQKLKPLMRDILSWKTVFPVLIEDLQSKSKTSLLSGSTDDDDSGLGEADETDEEDLNPEINPRLPKLLGFTRMSVKIEKIGVKDTGLIDPVLSVSVRDSASVHLAPAVHIQLPKKVEDYHIYFDTRIEIQRYIEKIPKGSHVFFELRHKKNGKYKTKCFAVLNTNEFKATKGFLELYKGPTDYHMKTLEKFTQKKPLYLHLQIKLHD